MSTDDEGRAGTPHVLVAVVEACALLAVSVAGGALLGRLTAGGARNLISRLTR